MTASIRSAVLGEVPLESAPRRYSAEEIQELNAAEPQLAAARLDLYSAEGQAIAGKIIDDYFQKNRHIPMTTTEVFRAINLRRSECRNVSVAEYEWRKLEATNPPMAQELIGYLNSLPAVPGQLITTGDDAFINLKLLFEQLSGRHEQVSATTIDAAKDRIAHRPGPQLKFTESPRRTTPISRAAKEDDGTPFLSGRVNMTAADHRREALAAQQQARENSEDRSTIRGRQDQIAEAEANALRGHTHSDTAKIQRLFVSDQHDRSKIDWQATLAARKRMQSALADRSIR